MDEALRVSVQVWPKKKEGPTEFLPSSIFELFKSSWRASSFSHKRLFFLMQKPIQFTKTLSNLFNKISHFIFKTPHFVSLQWFLFEDTERWRKAPKKWSLEYSTVTKGLTQPKPSWVSFVFPTISFPLPQSLIYKHRIKRLLGERNKNNTKRPFIYLSIYLSSFPLVGLSFWGLGVVVLLSWWKWGWRSSKCGMW